MYATLENPHSIRPPFFGLPIRPVPNNALSAIWSQFRSLGHRLNGYGKRRTAEENRKGHLTQMAHFGLRA